MTDNGVNLVVTSPTAAEQPEQVLRGMLRRQGSDYLLEERPHVPGAPWTLAPIRRVDVPDASPIDLADYLNRDIVVGAAPIYVLSRRHMVMRITWVRPA
jgi:hypothetical protein